MECNIRLNQELINKNKINKWKNYSNKMGIKIILWMIIIGNCLVRRILLIGIYIHREIRKVKREFINLLMLKD
jgi:hypothetical protein